MIVYALQRHYLLESTELLSIHATRDGAELAAQTLHTQNAPDDRALEFIEQSAHFWKTWGSPEYHITALMVGA
jgi:hypothetical protein